ncbi:IS1380 family transposase [Microbacterium lacticum]|uniref:IS1380 family transposase n=1 Tax=Microbacterium lacticum TaxID=33885 RepID=UPI0018B09E65|nr:IS1380 family transposase [Microbacterium lacticum]
MKASHGLVPVFDDRNLVSHAGLSPVLELAEKAGLAGLIEECSTLPVANVAVKSRTVLAGMLAGADSIDDLDLLRAGGTARVVGAVRAPSTIGTFLRSFTHGHALQFGKVNRVLLRRLIGQIPALAGAAGGLVMVDMDDTIREVHGSQKQAAAFGYSGVRGLNALLVTVTGQDAAPLVAEASLRRGNVRSGDHAAHHLARALTTVRESMPGRQVLTRADSAFCTHENVTTAIRQRAWFSFTIPAWPTVARAIAGISEDAWTRIEYPGAVRDEDTGELVSDAEVAETEFTAFVSRPKGEQIACRLVVRRVKRLNENATVGQETLFDTWRYHAFITNSPLTAVDADRFHRGHAIVEQVIAELKGGPLAHLPSGVFTANAAWVQFAALAHNLARAAATAAGLGRARMGTLLRLIIQTPARLANTARRVVMHLPAHWPWAHAWARLWETATSPPRIATT